MMRSGLGLAVAAIAVAAAVLAACTGDAAPPGPTGPTPPTATSGSAALPADQQCLPLDVCDKWSGCALVAKAGTRWRVITADGFASGDLVDVTNVCTSGDTCTAVKGAPKGVQCPAWTTPIYIAPPSYTCAWNGSVCAQR